MKRRDWCSLSPDRFGRWDWSGCCMQHDEDYATHQVSRAQADRDLRECIRLVTHGRVLPWVYWIGVRCFGWLAWSRHRPHVGARRRWRLWRARKLFGVLLVAALAGGCVSPGTRITYDPESHTATFDRGWLEGPVDVGLDVTLPDGTTIKFSWESVPAIDAALGVETRRIELMGRALDLAEGVRP